MMIERIVGREAELAAGQRFLDAAAGRAGVLELVGDPGIGKTTVWRGIVERAEARGFTVLRCRPAETETKLALSALADLFEPVPSDQIDLLPEPQARALRSAILRAEADGSPPQPATLGAAARTLLSNLSDAAPVLVAVDDVQWLDGASAAVLAYALRRLSDVSVAWLVATRRVASSRLGVDRLDPNRVERIEVGPISLGAMHHVIEDRVEQQLTRSSLVRAHQASGGNPFYGIEIARELLSGGAAPAGTTPVPRDLRDLVMKRIRRLPTDTRGALLMASAMSEPTTAAIEASALEPAERAAVVRIDEKGRITFGHPLFSAAVYEAATHAERQLVHGRLAATSTDPEERARHLAAATTDVGEEVARTVEEGAARARSRGSWESAAELLEHAARLTPAERKEERIGRLTDAAEYFCHAGDRPRGRVLIEAVLGEELPHGVRAKALRVFADICWNDEDIHAAARAFEQALELAEDPTLVTTCQIGRAYCAAYVMDFDRALEHAREALENAERIGDTGQLAEALGYSAMYEFLTGRGVDWDKVRRAVELEDTSRVVSLLSRPTTVEAFLHLYSGDHSGARERMRAIVTRFASTGDESDLAYVLLWLSWLESRCGNLNEAERLAIEAERLARLTGSTSLATWASLQHAYVLAHRGNTERTRLLCAEGIRIAEQEGSIYYFLWAAASLALLEISRREPQAALDACASFVTVIEQVGIAEPVPLFFVGDALEALVLLGQIDRADSLIEGLERRGRELDRAWALVIAGRAKALALAARGDLGAALEAAENTVKEHQRIELPFEEARTLLVKGVIERRLRRRAKAKASFEGALAEFERIGTPLWAERTREELARLGLERRSGAELTDSEQRVAELTAKGMTRKAVAAALYISPKTVDATLVRVYRKLGVGSRAELGARMAGSPQE